MFLSVIEFITVNKNAVPSSHVQYHIFQFVVVVGHEKPELAGVREGISCYPPPLLPNRSREEAAEATGCGLSLSAVASHQDTTRLCFINLQQPSASVQNKSTTKVDLLETTVAFRLICSRQRERRREEKRDDSKVYTSLSCLVRGLLVE